MESLDILPLSVLSVAAADVGMLLAAVDCCCVAAGAGVADTKPLNSLLRPSRSWAEAELGTLAADEAEEGVEEEEDSDNPNKSVSKVLADLTILLATAGLEAATAAAGLG